jgi:peroxiredoxin
MRYAKTVLLSCLLLLMVVVPSWAMGNSSYISQTLVGKPAADFTLDTLKDKAVNMTKYRDGKKAILFFWATWCPHCRVELKRLNELKDDFKAKGIQIILVSLGEPKETVQEYITRHQYSFDVFLDTNQTLEESYQLIGVPTLYFIDENGTIKYMDHALPEDYQAPFASK